MNNCVLFEGCLYGIDGQTHNRRLANLVCMDFETGKSLWTHNGLGCGSLMMAGDKLILLSDDGELETAQASRDRYKNLSHCSVVEGKCWTVPVLSHARIYVRDAAGDLICLDAHESVH